MKRYDLTLQEKDCFCVPACLQAVFRRHGLLDMGQGEIANNLTRCDAGYSVSDDSFRSFVGRMGFGYDFYRHNETPFNEPDSLLGENNRNNDILVGVDLIVFFC